MNGIIENIGSAEKRLQEMEKTNREEKEALDNIKKNAKTAYVGGQMSDFRMWQRIGRGKKTNIESALKKADNTISEARRIVESEIQRVNWVSDGEKKKNLKQIKQRLSQLGSYTATIKAVSGDLTQHITWIEVNE
ncbi:hypothetical protein ACFL47_02675 [Candidatus Latescibacterota bacterium]